MPEQDGKPGNLFKGPLFAAVMVAIGTMTLAMTAYTLLVENFDIKNAERPEEAAANATDKARKKSSTRARKPTTTLPRSKSS